MCGCGQSHQRTPRRGGMRPAPAGPLPLRARYPPGYFRGAWAGCPARRLRGALMDRKKVLVLGGNFGGLTAALAVKHELHGDVDVRVVSAADRFLFNPSLIWLPFGKRSAADITFPLAPTFETYGIDFVHAEATTLDLAGRKVATTAG